MVASEIKLNVPYIRQDDENNEYPISFDDLLNDFAQGSYKYVTKGEILDIQCPNCSNKSFERKFYFKNYPKYLMVQIQRFAYDNWVPKKIQAYINFPNQNINLDFLKLPQIQEQLIMKDQINDPAKLVNQDNLSNLIGMGFSENRCVRALQSNGDDLEQALNWIFNSLDDESLDLPLQQKQSANKSCASEDNIALVLSMGFTYKQSQLALEKTDNNVERAIDYLFSHPDIEEESQQQEIQQDQNNQNIQYQLKSAIVHLGKSMECGHYISYSKINSKWTYFNDEKIAQTQDPLLGKSYMVIFERQD